MSEERCECGDKIGHVKQCPPRQARAMVIGYGYSRARDIAVGNMCDKHANVDDFWTETVYEIDRIGGRNVAE